MLIRRRRSFQRRRRRRRSIQALSTSVPFPKRSLQPQACQIHRIWTVLGLAALQAQPAPAGAGGAAPACPTLPTLRKASGHSRSPSSQRSSHRRSPSSQRSSHSRSPSSQRSSHRRNPSHRAEMQPPIRHPPAARQKRPSVPQWEGPQGRRGGAIIDHHAASADRSLRPSCRRRRRKSRAVASATTGAAPSAAPAAGCSRSRGCSGSRDWQWRGPSRHRRRRSRGCSGSRECKHSPSRHRRRRSMSYERLLQAQAQCSAADGWCESLPMYQPPVSSYFVLGPFFHALQHAEQQPCRRRSHRCSQRQAHQQPQAQ